MINNELYHHGIKGQKWGVRRYQNYDGSYTKKGLARYNKAVDNYKDKKNKLQEARQSHDKSAIRSAKNEASTAAREANKAYTQLQKDYRADKGKALYGKGRTISGNTKVATLAGSGLAVAGSIAVQALETNGKLNNINYTAIAAGTTAVGLILGAKLGTDNRNLRAYYAHG